MRRVRQGGTQALRSRRSTVAPPRLDSEQKTSLVHFLEQGTTAHGFVHNWTYSRIAIFIAQHFGVSYHQGHIPKLLASLNWTPPHRRQFS